MPVHQTVDIVKAAEVHPIFDQAHLATLQLSNHWRASPEHVNMRTDWVSVHLDGLGAHRPQEQRHRLQDDLTPSVDMIVIKAAAMLDHRISRTPVGDDCVERPRPCVFGDDWSLFNPSPVPALSMPSEHGLDYEDWYAEAAAVLCSRVDEVALARPVRAPSGTATPCLKW